MPLPVAVENVKSGDTDRVPLLLFTWKWYRVCATRPVRFTLCAVTSVELRAEAEPYPVVVPYSTWVSAGTSVVQVMVAAEERMLFARTDEITGLPAVTVIVLLLTTSV